MQLSIAKENQPLKTIFSVKVQSHKEASLHGVILWFEVFHLK